MQRTFTDNVEVLIKGLFREGIIKAFPALSFIPEILITQGKIGKSDKKPADFQCNNVMALARVLGQEKSLKITPKDIGDIIIKSIPSNEIIERSESTQQGFINIYIATQWIAEAVRMRTVNGLVPPPVEKHRVLIDFSSPNIAKEMHVGHLRSTIIGDSIARLLEYCGLEVRRINHVGDWGTQFGMLISHLREVYGDSLENRPEIGDLVEVYRASKKRFDEDDDFKNRARLEVVRLQALEPDNIKAWKIICDISRNDFQQIYDRLNVRLEERGESFYNPYIPDVIKMLEEKSQIEMSDGASVIISKEAKSISELDVKDMARLLSYYVIRTPRGQKTMFDHNLIIVMKKLDILTGEEGQEIVKLSKKEMKPLDKFDAQKDIDKLAKMLEPSYLKKPLDDLFLDIFKTAGIVNDDGKTIMVPRFNFPLMVKKRDNGYTYDTTDIACMWHRFVHEDYFRVIYVTDVGQFEHFRMLAQLAKDMNWISNGKNWAHGGFGLVSGEDGKKLKTRSGETIKLKDLLDEAVDRCYKTLQEREAGDNKQGHTEEEMRELARKIGYGAVKYFDLKQNRTTDYSFSYDKILDTSGNTAVYMLYSYARIMSIRRKAGVSDEELLNTQVTFENEKEKALGLCALRMNAVLLKTIEDLYLSHITDFVYELTGKLSEFYSECQVVGHPLQNSRLVILKMVADTMTKCLDILGIEVADRL